jgi:hypothetical protein
MLTKGYGLSPDFARQLLEDHQIVFLLDGLDELARNETPERASEMRSQCLAAIDKTLHDGTMSVVICCRRAEYDLILNEIGIEPPVTAVVFVRDLTPERIGRALERARDTPRDKFAARHLLAALEQDRESAFHNVLATPFYFTTALQVFDSTKPPDLMDLPEATLESTLVTAFVEKKLQVTSNAEGFSASDTLNWLSWLAKLLKERNRVTFELSDLQPSSLKRRWLYRLVLSLTFGVFGTLIVDKLHISLESIFPFALFSLIGSYVISEDFSRLLFESLRRFHTWFNILWQALLVSVLGAWAFVLWLVWTRGTFGGLAAAIGTLMLAVIYLVGALVVGFILTVGLGLMVRLIIPLVSGVFGRAFIGEIYTEDFAEWKLNPLRQSSTWRQILDHAMGACGAGSAMGSVVFGIFGSIHVFTSGGSYGGFYLFVIP